MKSFNLIDQIIFMPLNALIKDEYIFSFGDLIYNSSNNETKLNDGDIEFTQLFTRSIIQFYKNIMMPI